MITDACTCVCCLPVTGVPEPVHNCTTWDNTTTTTTTTTTSSNTGRGGAGQGDTMDEGDDDDDDDRDAMDRRGTEWGFGMGQGVTSSPAPSDQGDTQGAKGMERERDNVQGRGVSTGQVIVECQAGWSGGLQQTFSLEVREGEGGEVLAALRHQAAPHFTVAGLLPGREYELAIVASNAHGSARPTLLLHHTPIDVAEKRMSPAAHDAGHAHGGGSVVVFSPLVGVAVGLVASLLLCTIVIVLIARNRAAANAAATTNSAAAAHDDRHDDHTKILYDQPPAATVTAASTASSAAAASATTVITHDHNHHQQKCPDVIRVQPGESSSMYHKTE